MQLLMLEAAPTEDAPAPCPAARHEAPSTPPMLDASAIREESLRQLVQARDVAARAALGDPAWSAALVRLADAVDRRLGGAS